MARGDGGVVRGDGGVVSLSAAASSHSRAAAPPPSHGGLWAWGVEKGGWGGSGLQPPPPYKPL